MTKRWLASLIFSLFTFLSPVVCPAEDTDQIRFYIALRLGAALITDAHFPSGLDVPTVADQQAFSASVGLNLGRYWGLEVATDIYESDLNFGSPGGFKIGEYSVYTFIPQVRLRYPLLNGRLTPYVVGGGGWGFTEYNDPSFPPFSIDKARETTTVWSVGGGIEYFVANNIAVGVEAKFLFFRDVQLRIDGNPQEADFDSLLLTAGLRIFFPEARRLPSD